MKGGGGGQQQGSDQISSFFWVICIFAGVHSVHLVVKAGMDSIPVFKFRIYEILYFELSGRRLG